ncbi:MAG: YbaK/EbsC family protein [Gammaproteobacteria bacterium]|nr:YbaK/EbsC family protein [Gammaproteobacteria bacterium]
MAIALTIQEFLDWEEISYTVIKHPFTMSSVSTAEAAHIPADHLAKTVVLVDDVGFVMVILPADEHVDLPRLRKIYNRQFMLANEQEIEDLFYDCEQGAIPALGEAYGFEMLVDDKLLTEQEDIFVEGGDHCALIQLDGQDFKHLMSHAEHGHFCH